MYLLFMVGFSLIANIVILIFGLKAKTAENLGLFQALPTIFMFALFYLGLEATEIWFPLEDSDGYDFGFLVIMPTIAFAVISTTTLGIRGLVKKTGQGNLFLTVISVLAATAMLTYTFGIFALPVAFAIILIVKVKRKLKQKRDKAPDIIS